MRLDIRSGRLVPALLVALLLGACGATPTRPTAVPGTLRVVTTTTVLADFVRNVGGDRVSVDSLVPKGGEPHTFDPSPRDLARVADAELIVANGLGLDDWLANLARRADAATTPLVELAPDLPGVTYLGDAEHDGERANPHIWLNVTYARTQVARLRDALAAADPPGAPAYAAGFAAYDTRLEALDGWARDRIAAVPAADRRIVSFHDAFAYLAAAYGLEVVGVAVEAPGQEPSAGEIARLVEAIRAADVRAVFSEAQFPPDLVREIATETGATVESALYSDSLGDPPVDTYEGLVRWDVDRIVEALT